MNESSNRHLGNYIISERYRIIRPLASGGMARVFLAEDLRLQRQVALKIIHPHLAEDPAFIEKFRREAILAASLNHPNLVNVSDQGSDGQNTYLVMEYVPGRTLRDVLNEFGKLNSSQALEIMESVLAGLAAAHRAGILHRDLKPENVLLADDGRIKLSDFGLARPVSAHTETDSVIGTAAYLSPELVTRGQANTESDVYAAGVLFYELLTGRQPFTGENAAHIAAQHASSSIEAPSLIEPNVPDFLDRIVLAATQRQPGDRPRDAGALLQAIQKAKTGTLDLHALAKTQRLSDPTRLNQTTVLNTTGTSATEVIANQTSVISSADESIDEDHPLSEFETKHSFAKWLIVTVASILIGSTIGWYFSAGPGALRAIPSTQNRTVTQATQSLENLGFEIKIENQNSTNAAKGLVIGTSPSAGQLASPGSTVTLFVSNGPKLIKVPNLRGIDVATATTKILSAGFTFGGAEAWFNSLPVGQVFDYLGSDGAKQPEGTPITLQISLGPLPAVANVPQQTAIDLLTSVGLQVTQIEAEYSDTVRSGNVINAIPQTEPAGEGTEIRLIVSKGPSTVAMPKVVGETIDAAKTLLQSLGLVVIIDTNKLTSQYGIAKVTSVSVQVGTIVKRGSSVTIRSR